jgi:CO/xanthine dehydrogenase Mo-binding subunit
MPDLTTLDPMTGAGKAGPYWTVGAQAVEVEYDPQEFTYRFIKAATVLDAGKVINPKTAKGLIMGGMCMGLGLGSREAFSYKKSGEVETTSLRSYKVLHYGETPQYLVDFVETPQLDAPYGARGFGEHGILGIPAALANALTAAAGVELDQLPVTPEAIWRISTGGLS